MALCETHATLSIFPCPLFSVPYPAPPFLNQGRGIERWNSSMNMGSSRVSTSQRFAQPLVSEGQGSVFPVGLPLSKRRALEVDIIKRFDRRDFVDSYDVVCCQRRRLLSAVSRRSELSVVFRVGAPVGTHGSTHREGKTSTGGTVGPPRNIHVCPYAAVPLSRAVEAPLPPPPTRPFVHHAQHAWKETTNVRPFGALCMFPPPRGA